MKIFNNNFQNKCNANKKNEQKVVHNTKSNKSANNARHQKHVNYDQLCKLLTNNKQARTINSMKIEQGNKC